MPTSVLLAVLAAAGLLALAPALTRRYDVPERVAAERATSTARVLSRRRRRRTVPRSRPVNPPRVRLRPVSTAGRSGVGGRSASAGRSFGAGRSASGRGSGGRSGVWSSAPRQSSASRRARRYTFPRRPRPGPTALHRRRRVFVALVVLNLVELAGVFLVGPGFWIGFSVSFTVLLADLVYLRRRAVLSARRGRAVRRRQAWIAAQQAAVRREHDAGRRERLVAFAGAWPPAPRPATPPRATPYTERYTGHVRALPLVPSAAILAICAVRSPSARISPVTVASGSVRGPVGWLLALSTVWGQRPGSAPVRIEGSGFELSSLQVRGHLHPSEVAFRSCAQSTAASRVR